jgi:hypothetical protein
MASNGWPNHEISTLNRSAEDICVLTVVIAELKFRTAHLTPELAGHGGALLIRHIERLRHTFPASRHSTAFIAVDPR